MNKEIKLPVRKYQLGAAVALGSALAALAGGAGAYYGSKELKDLIESGDLSGAASYIKDKTSNMFSGAKAMAYSDLARIMKAKDDFSSLFRVSGYNPSVLYDESTEQAGETTASEEEGAITETPESPQVNPEPEKPKPEKPKPKKPKQNLKKEVEDLKKQIEELKQTRKNRVLRNLGPKYESMKIPWGKIALGIGIPAMTIPGVSYYLGRGVRAVGNNLGGFTEGLFGEQLEQQSGKQQTNQTVNPDTIKTYWRDDMKSLLDL